MKIITKIEEIRPEKKSAVVIGKFDGVHIGHRALLNSILEEKKVGCQAVAVTFSPSPAVYFGLSDGYKLTTDLEKRKILEKLGIDILIEYPLTPETVQMEPEAFLKEILCERLQAGLVAAGPDLSFGKKGRGNFRMLQQYAAVLGFKTVCIDKICLRGKEVSSSLIRELVEEGKMEDAAECLGEPYSITGTVVHGARLGRTMGMPTANLLPEEDKLLPPLGVYYAKAVVGEKTYYGVTNIGQRPTLKDGRGITAETYLYDFAGDLYGRKLQVQLCSFRRPEKKFSGVEELRNCMERDLEAGRKYFGV